MSQSPEPDDGTTRRPTAGELAELGVRANQIGRLTFRQFDAIREQFVMAGLAPQVAAVTAWLAADPQALLAQLKRPRMDVVAPGVTARVIDIDVLTAPLVRAPENLRMAGHRYEGDFSMPQYSSMSNNSALLLDLEHLGSPKTALEFYFGELAKTDTEINEKNRYGADIRANGIRVGGILFPLFMRFPGSGLGVAGWETADCYGRTYFTQEAEGITAAHVLEWMRTVPTDARDLATHPLQHLRNRLLAIAGKVRSGTPLSSAEDSQLRRAVMPRTRLVVSVDVEVPMDEVRRRVVSLQHLDRPTSFSSITDWQTRSEAVLAWFEQKDLMARPDGIDSSTARRWLDAPADAVLAGECFGDDIAMIAIASMLHSPGTKLDRQVGLALRTRGVTGEQRTHARTEVVAHVICRALRDNRSEGARSAMERVLQWSALRDQGVDVRPVLDLLTDAERELDSEAEARSLGQKTGPGPATRQLAARAAFHLICGPATAEPLLRRSDFGAAKGQGVEPGQVLQKLAATRAGQRQLAQAVLDGRRGLPIRRLAPDATAAESTQAAPESERLDSTSLRRLALENRPMIVDSTPAMKVRSDSDVLNDLVGKVTAVVTSLGNHAEPSLAAPLPYVEDRGWADPHGTIGTLQTIQEKLHFWHQIHAVMNRRRPADEGAS